MGVKLDRVLSTRNAASIKRTLGLTPPGTHTPSAWFLGPNAENLDILKTMVGIVMDDHADARRSYAPNDPDMTGGRGPEFMPTVTSMEQNLRVITRELRSSIPLSSHRNMSHMYWDITMPGAVGYFAGLLYNQNNCAAEASPVTTNLEIRAAGELCEMLGYDMSGAPTPWGHITCDGTVANIESMWAARNLRYQAVAIARALLMDPALEAARGIMITKGDGIAARLVDLETWEMVNLPMDQLLALPRILEVEGGLSKKQIEDILCTYSIRDIGVTEFHEHILHAEQGPNTVKMTPAIMVPATAHYSWAKAATVLGLGRNAMQSIEVDLEGRMKLSALARALETCLHERRPVVQVVAVMGSTGEGAVDPLADILKLRAKFEARGLSFAVHADAAWGGYFAATLEREDARVLKIDEEETAFDAEPHEAMNAHSRKHFAVMGGCDTITVDPHKAGFIPYPAGALCYRDKEMIYLISETSPVVYHDGDAPTVGVYGIEGSKPGAAAVGVALSHITIPTTPTGYGRLLGRCLFNAKRFHAGIVQLATPEDDFIVVPMMRLPVERRKEGATDAEIDAQIVHIREAIFSRDNDALIAAFDKDAELKKLFQSLGPDLTVLAYAFNFKVNGKINKRLDLMNEFNNAIYHRLSFEVPEVEGAVPEQPMFVTSSSFSPATHSAAFIEGFCKRLKVRPTPGTAVRHLISTTQNPFLSATAAGDFIPTLMDIMRDAVEAERKNIIAKHKLDKKKD